MFFKLLFRQVGLPFRHFQNRQGLFISLFGDFGRLKIADDRVQSGHEDRVQPRLFALARPSL